MRAENVQTADEKWRAENSAWVQSFVSDPDIRAEYSKLDYDQQRELTIFLTNFIAGIRQDMSAEDSWNNAIGFSNYRASGGLETSAGKYSFWEYFKADILPIMSIPLVAMALGSVAGSKNFFAKIYKAASPYLKKIVIDTALTTALTAAADAGLIYAAPSTLTTAGQDKTKLYFFGALALIALFFLSR